MATSEDFARAVRGRIDAAENPDAAAHARILDALGRPSSGAAVSRVGADYRLWHGIGGGVWMRYLLKAISAYGNVVSQLAGLDMVLCHHEHAVTTATATGTWVDGTNAAAIGGTYKHSTVAASALSFTTPAATTAVAIGTPKATNGGRVAVVAINGDRARANLLPSAQFYVDAGWLAASALTTNGGTLAPTDRLIDTYAPAIAETNWAGRVMAADGLRPAAHTVTVTATEYVRTGLDQTQRTYVSGITTATDTTTPATAGVTTHVAHVLSDVSSAWEYAYRLKPAGTAAAGETGNIHGNEIQAALAFTVDGSAVTLTDGQAVVAARTLSVTRSTRHRHAELTEDMGETVTIYTVDRYGLTVAFETTWDVSAAVDWAWVMLPVNGATAATGVQFTRAATLGSYAHAKLNGTADTYALRAPASAAWAWTTDPQHARLAVAAIVENPSEFLNRQRQAAPAFTQVQDRNGAITKLYFARVSASAAGATVAAGDVWRSRARYLATFLPTDSSSVVESL